MQVLSKYYIEETYTADQYTAGIVRKDNETILAEEGFQKILFRYVKKGSALVKISRLINTLSVASGIPGKSLVVFHFPLLANAYFLLLRLLKKRGIYTAALIIDIDGLRDKDPVKLKKEIGQLAKFDFLIAHNEAMKDFILQHIPGARIFTIQLFDYPVKNTPPARTFSKTICIAANHAKGKYVYGLGEIAPVQFNLYGEGYDAASQPGAFNVSFKGVIAPDSLPAVMEGSFGLVWDGASITGCDEYLQYNNPHKLSLYIAAGLPVIVWSRSAVASLVLQNNIGITVNSLSELDTVISTISENDYERKKQNVMAIRDKFKDGYYLKTVIYAVISSITQP